MSIRSMVVLAGCTVAGAGLIWMLMLAEARRRGPPTASQRALFGVLGAIVTTVLFVTVFAFVAPRLGRGP